MKHHWVQAESCYLQGLAGAWSAFKTSCGDKFGNLCARQHLSHQRGGHIAILELNFTWRLWILERIRILPSTQTLRMLCGPWWPDFRAGTNIFKPWLSFGDYPCRTYQWALVNCPQELHVPFFLCNMSPWKLPSYLQHLHQHKLAGPRKKNRRGLVFFHFAEEVYLVDLIPGDVMHLAASNG